MAVLKSRSECLLIHNQISASRRDVLVKWEKIMQEILRNDPIVSARFSVDVRDSIELWIASASATVRASAWITCQRRFEDTLIPLLPSEIDKLHLNWWDGKFSRPCGELPISIIENYTEFGNIRKYDDVRFLYKHAIGVHTKMWNINKWHPGKWHPTFQQRAMNQIMFYDAVIRYLGWVLGENTLDHALYAYNDTVLNRLNRSLDGVGLFSMDIMKSAHNENFKVRDHHRNEFNT